MLIRIRVSYKVFMLSSLASPPCVKTVGALDEGVGGRPSGGGPVSGASLIIMVGWEAYVGISIVYM